MANDNSAQKQSLSAEVEEALHKAAHAIKNSKALFLTSGAGLGVDSGLPDFRGPEGFWRACPPMAKLGLRFEAMSNPSWFTDDPSFAWGFWFHRYSLYTNAVPHEGYHIMKKWAESKSHYFVFTSNVDGHWRKVGIPDDKLEECHGAVDFLQCLESCTEEIWPATESFTECSVDKETFRATSVLPKCKNCDLLARPNVLMFQDFGWISERCGVQRVNYKKFQDNMPQDSNLAIVEIGAGKAIPTVRDLGEHNSRKHKGTLIRINVRDSDIPKGVNGISIPLGGKDALERIDAILKTL